MKSRTSTWLVLLVIFLRASISQAQGAAFLVAPPASSAELAKSGSATTSVNPLLQPGALSPPPIGPAPEPLDVLPLTIPENEHQPSPRRYDNKSHAPEERKRFHFGIGSLLGAAAILTPSFSGFGPFPVYALVPVTSFEITFDWTFGVVGLRFSPGIHGLLVGSIGFGGGLHLQIRFNAGSVYAFGLGGHLGVSFYSQIASGLSANSSLVILGPTVSPVILKFGTRGQHQIEARVSLPNILAGSFVPSILAGYSILF